MMITLWERIRAFQELQLVEGEDFKNSVVNFSYNYLRGIRKLYIISFELLEGAVHGTGIKRIKAFTMWC